MKLGRKSCINPCCKRAGPADQFPGEMICGKCFNTLPKHVRTNHRFYWIQIRKWRKRIAKTSDELKLARMRNILHMWQERLNSHWDAEIKARVVTPQKPEGLEAFLEEVGL